MGRPRLVRTEKRCPRCGETKPLSDYYVRKNGQITGYCKPCAVECVRQLHRKDPAKHAAYNRDWYRRNPNKKPDAHLKRRLGIPEGTYDRMFAEQHGRCAICGTTHPGRKGARRLSVDHCAETGIVRGLLCQKCNIGIGHLQHSIDLLLRSIEYLRSSSQRYS